MRHALFAAYLTSRWPLGLFLSCFHIPRIATPTPVGHQVFDLLHHHTRWMDQLVMEKHALRELRYSIYLPASCRDKLVHHTPHMASYFQWSFATSTWNYILSTCTWPHIWCWVPGTILLQRKHEVVRIFMALPLYCVFFWLHIHKNNSRKREGAWFEAILRSIGWYEWGEYTIIQYYTGNHIQAAVHVLSRTSHVGASQKLARFTFTIIIMKVAVMFCW